MTTKGNARHYSRPFTTLARGVTRKEAVALVAQHRSTAMEGMRIRMKPLGRHKGYRVMAMVRPVPATR
jgi:hypothetical protein